MVRLSRMTSKDLQSPFAEPRKPRVVAPASRDRAASRTVLEGCWAPAWRVLSHRIVEVIRAAADAGAKGADEAASRPARRLLAHIDQFVARYERALRDELKQALDDFVARRIAAEPAARSRNALKLVDYGAMELSTLLEAAAARALNAVDDHYSSLKLRLARLVREVEIREADSPFRPVLFFRALQRAVKELDTFSDAELVELLPRFDSPMLGPLVQVYAELDLHLKKQGYSAEVPPLTVWRSTTRGRPSQGGGSGARMHAAAGGGGGMSAAGAEQLLSLLYQRLNLGSLPTGALSAAAAAGGGDPVVGLHDGGDGDGDGGVGGAVQAPAAVALPDGGAAAGGDGAGHVLQADLMSAIAEIQKLGALAMMAVQQGQPAPDSSIDNAQLRDKLIEKADDRVDKLTIEIVGLLFERINQDRHVPQPIKEALQRLQFPMIRVALTVPELLVSPEQPARMLIDRIASTSVGWTSEGQENQRFLAEVQKAVHAVLSSKEEGLAPFEEALEAFEHYLMEERTRDDDPVARAKKALAEAENREVMAINVMIQVRGLFDGLQIESYLREFLLETWVRVVVASQLSSPDDPNAVQKYLVIVPDLVWSVQPKLALEDRKRLVSIIPPVLTVLREGLALIAWPEQSMQEFFGRLMKSHAQAVKALELAHGNPGKPAPPAADAMIKSRMESIKLDRLADTLPPSDMPVRLNEHIVKQVLAANQVDVSLLPQLTRRADYAGALDDEELDAMIGGFKRGDWFSLRVGDVVERVRLRWISPQQTLYLFTPADGRRAHSVAPEALREYLRQRHLQPVVVEPLFDRALRGMVYELEQSASGA